MSKRKSDLEYCNNAYDFEHDWQDKGVSQGYIYQCCLHCDKWKREKIEYVIGGKQE